MKKIISIILSITMLSLPLTACSSGEGGDDKRTKVAIVTEDKQSDSQSFRAAKNIADLYALRNKDKSSNDVIEHFVMPSDYVTNPKKSEKIVKKIVADEEIGAVVFSGKNDKILDCVNEIKSAREDIITMGANLNLPIDKMSENLDLSFIQNESSSGKDTVMLAKEMGAEQFLVYYSDKDLKEKKELNKKISEIKDECKNQNIEFVEVKVNDINSKEDEYKVKKFISEDLEKQIYKYGKNINVYGTNSTMDDVILRRGIKSKVIISEISDGCLVDEMNDLYRNIMKTGEIGNFKGNASLIVGKNSKYNMDKKVGGLLMPNDMFTIYAAADTAMATIEGNVDDKKMCKAYFIEESMSQKDGISGSVKNAKAGINNVKIVSVDQIMY